SSWQLVGMFQLILPDTYPLRDTKRAASWGRSWMHPAACLGCVALLCRRWSMLPHAQKECVANTRGVIRGSAGEDDGEHARPDEGRNAHTSAMAHAQGRSLTPG